MNNAIEAASNALALAFEVSGPISWRVSISRVADTRSQEGEEAAQEAIQDAMEQLRHARSEIRAFNPESLQSPNPTPRFVDARARGWFVCSINLVAARRRPRM